MFTFETLTSQYAKNAKQALGYVQDEKLKKELVALTDAQVAYANGIYNSTMDITKTVLEASKIDLSKFGFAAK